MIKRYNKAEKRETEDNEKFYETRFLPDVERRPTDVIITVDKPQRLDRIAFQYYDDAKLWWVVAAANNIGRGDWNVSAGTRLRIPQNLSAIASETKDINDKR